MGKRSRHSRCMRNPQFCVSGKRPIDLNPRVTLLILLISWGKKLNRYRGRISNLHLNTLTFCLTIDTNRPRPVWINQGNAFVYQRVRCRYLTKFENYWFHFCFSNGTLSALVCRVLINTTIRYFVKRPKMKYWSVNDINCPICGNGLIWL